MHNVEMRHGLFGKAAPGEIQEFITWKEAARHAWQISERNINIYRGIISFNRDTANELGLITQKDWQKYIETHISIIARANNIKVQNLEFVCAVHNERMHPHIHIDFWDKEQQIQCNFTHKEIPNKIRKQLIKDTFGDRIREYCEQKDKGKTEIREVTDGMVLEFENYVKEVCPKEYLEYQKLFETFDEEAIFTNTPYARLSAGLVTSFADRLFNLKELMPKSGRLSYQLLPEETKMEIDAFVIELLQNNSALRQSVKLYVEGKMNMALLYSSNKGYLSRQKKIFQKEAEKLIANRMLSVIKVILKKEFGIERAEKRELYLQEQKHYYTNALFVGLFDLFERLLVSNQRRFSDLQEKVMGMELSKEALKEHHLKNKDKNVEKGIEL